MKLPINRWIDPTNLISIGSLLRPHHGLDPDAVHLGLDFALSINEDSTARSIAKLLGTRHRAGHAGHMQDTLAAHLTVEKGFLDKFFDRLDPSGRTLDANPAENSPHPT